MSPARQGCFACGAPLGRDFVSHKPIQVGAISLSVAFCSVCAVRNRALLEAAEGIKGAFDRAGAVVGDLAGAMSLLRRVLK